MVRPSAAFPAVDVTRPLDRFSGRGDLQSVTRVDHHGDFVGRRALQRIKEAGIERRLCCLTLDDPSVVVMGKEPIWTDGRVAGYVTSAAYGAAVAR